MKMPEPVAYLHVPMYQIGDQKIRPVASIIKYNEPDVYREVINLYGENQVRELLAQHEAAMRQALEALKRMERYGNTFLYRRDEQNPHEQTCEAIRALEDALK